MTGATLLEDLTRHGVKLWTEGGELRCRGPKKTLTPEVLAQLKEHKPEILKRLTPPAPVYTPAPQDTVVQCIHRLASDECKVCSGYVRWLITDEDRLQRLQSNPEAIRREFWHSVRGEA